MNSNGSEQTRLTNNPGVDNYPDWSPGWKEKLFTSRREQIELKFMLLMLMVAEKPI